MDQPDWAAVKAADASYPAMIAACVSAAASLLALVLAFFAVRWARAAAEAAQKQIAVLEKQVSLSEPRPVVFLRLAYAVAVSPPFVAFVANYGDDLAFDLRLSDLAFTYKTSAGEQSPRITFSNILVLKANEDSSFQFSQPPAIADARPEHMGNPGNSLIEMFMRKLFDEAGLRPSPDGSFCCAVLTLQYGSVHGKLFSQQYEFVGSPDGTITSRPVGSLISGD
jgi:hypothetical protein